MVSATEIAHYFFIVLFSIILICLPYFFTRSFDEKISGSVMVYMYMVQILTFFIIWFTAMMARARSAEKLRSENGADNVYYTMELAAPYTWNIWKVHGNDDKLLPPSDLTKQNCVDTFKSNCFETAEKAHEVFPCVVNNVFPEDEDTDEIIKLANKHLTGGESHGCRGTGMKTMFTNVLLKIYNLGTIEEVKNKIARMFNFNDGQFNNVPSIYRKLVDAIKKEEDDNLVDKDKIKEIFNDATGLDIEKCDELFTTYSGDANVINELLNQIATAEASLDASLAEIEELSNNNDALESMPEQGTGSDDEPSG